MQAVGLCTVLYHELMMLNFFPLFIFLNMNIIQRLSDKKEWENFLAYKLGQDGESKQELQDLQLYVDKEEYIPVVKLISNGQRLSPPKKMLISKSGSTKKRTVYSFNREENYLLKFLCFLLKEYDHIFAPNLYSFRVDRGVKNAVERLMNVKNVSSYYVYKVDISSYFNSACVDIVLLELKKVFEKDKPLYDFFEGLLKDTRVEFDGEIINENKGILPGVPVANFLANVYLSQLDFYFKENKIIYARYSDDIIVFAKTQEQLNSHVAVIKEFLANRKLTINSKKEKVSLPTEPWDFLGFEYCNGKIDVCEVSLKKIKAKMKRKMRALARWASRKNLPKEKAVIAFIKKINAKLYDNPIHNELTWTRWYFPIINTTKGLESIDAYMQECIRFLATGKRTNAKYNFRYQDIKALGYRNLVHEYYRYKNPENSQSEQEQIKGN